MAQKKQLQNNISQLSKGLHKDNSFVDQPKGTYSFCLNGVNETELGDFGFISNEESNEECASLTPGYVPIGKRYIGNNKTVILSVSANNEVSEIGILDADCNYQVYVNDEDSPEKEKLGFKIEQQIQITYRLRRGCERTIYFAGKGYPPRYFNFDKPNQFKKGTNWSAPKFNLYKKIEVFPTVDKVEVLDNSGNLIPGSYSVLVQHLDEDLNGTEFYELVKDINIYNDNLNKNYSDIQGSSNIGEDNTPYKYEKTNKAIQIALDKVDKSFTYIRFAFAERTSGNGLVSKVKYSDFISVQNPTFTYTGVNATTEGTIEEIELINMNAGIQMAEHIEQIDNMLILANVSGSQSKVCNLQKYASKIKTDCFVKDILLTTNKEAHNPKNPLVVHNGLGYQPGEIYSLGIVYIFDDYSVSPVCHIPGKSPLVGKSTVYSPESNVYPMSNVGNVNISERYMENTTCENNSYWGLDSEGTPLSNLNVRHHKFPTRDEIGIGFVKRTDSTGESITYKKLQLNLTGVLLKSNPTTGYVAPNFKLLVKYNRNNVSEYFQEEVVPDSNVFNNIVSSNIFLGTDIISDIKIFYVEEGSTTEIEIPLINGESAKQDNGLTYKVFLSNLTENNLSHIYTVPILGLKFSNIEIPLESEIGKKVIGYQIVRQERREVDKTILDSAVIFPMLKSGRNVSTGMLGPEFFNGVTVDGLAAHSSCEGSEDGNNPTCYNVSKRNIMLLTPGHKFMNKTYDGFTTIEQVGSFVVEYRARNVFSLQNIYEGTSASGEEDGKTDDDDGFSLRHGLRFAGVKYKTADTNNKYVFNNENTRMYDLEAVNYAETEDGAETLYNLSCDNKALVLSSTKPNVDLRTYRPGKDEFPYVYIKKENSIFYQSFRNNPYYLVDTQVFDTATTKVFGGDTYVSPLKYTSHIFGNAAVATRRKKMSTWDLIGSVVVMLLGMALVVFTGPFSLIGVGGILTALGAIATGTATVLEVAKFNEIYRDKWEKNLDKTVFDYFYASIFIKEYPEKTWEDYLHWEDDTFRWMGDGVGDLWFETPLNISLRVAPTNMENNYLKPLKNYPTDRPDRWFAMTLGHGVSYVGGGAPGSGDNFHRYDDLAMSIESNYEQYFLSKISKTNPSSTSGISYTGISTPQVYLVNPDHYVTTGIKKYYTIPFEYDCCSECQECFPHRIHYSQQSFQEEKSDNYRMFLPNNYRDIEGETGEITNIFRLHNTLFAHTKEALWQMGRNYQERVTDNIVSFIGTGSYFEIPPQKIVDDDTGSSAGTQHKWGMLKTSDKVFFPSENQRKIYSFDGKNIKPISNIGLENWFRENVKLVSNADYRKLKGVENPLSDNPSNKVGSGFISTLDSSKNRIIFTKKDISLSGEMLQAGSNYCIKGNYITLFPTFNQILIDKATEGWTYRGMENCKLKFSKILVTNTIQTITEQIFHPAVWEEQIDSSVSYLEKIKVEGSCPGGGNCQDSFYLDYIIPGEAIPRGFTSSHAESSSWVEFIDIYAFIPTPFSYNYNMAGEPNITEWVDETKIKKVKVKISDEWVEEITKEIIVNVEEEIFTYVEGDSRLLTPEDYTDNSWTISFSLKDNTWISWHSYLPNFYINTPEKFYSWKHGSNKVWKHNKLGHFQTYYGEYKPHIIEYTSSSNPITTRIWNHIMLQTEAKTYNYDLKQYHDERYVTFNKAVLYNSRQCSGEMDLVVKDEELGGQDYMMNQVINTNVNQSTIDRNERDWLINDFRDIRVDYSKPIWNSNISSLQSEYFIDKILNTSTLDINKDWTQLESFRDKYLVVRLIFDNFADKKLITNFSVENEQQSFY